MTRYKQKETSPLVLAFEQGAKWRESCASDFTMWSYDRSDAIKEANRLLRNGSFGKLRSVEDKTSDKFEFGDKIVDGIGNPGTVVMIFDDGDFYSATEQADASHPQPWVKI